jgi:two-component system, NarL family, sensor kinase
VLKDEAIINNNLEKVLEYDSEIKKIEKIIDEKALQFSVKVFEKKIDTAKKEKIIQTQKNKLTKSYFYISLLIALALIAMILYWVYSLRKKRNNALLEANRQEQFTFQLFQNTEEERSRIANELHDSVNHDLLNIKNNLINGKTIDANEVANVIEEVRNISRNLHPAILETVGLEASIEYLCERISEIGLFTTCDIYYTQKLSKNKELQLYRIIQEALSNTLKHGKANAAKVILTAENNSLHLEVKDNGNGFDVAEQLNNPKSFGLQSIMQRAKAIAAKININSNTNGTIILLKIPV